jgi:hypothetical protein
MERLMAIFELDQAYGLDIVTFISHQAEFEPYLRYVSLTKQAENVTQFTGDVRESLRYYVCFAGVRTAYGQQLYEMVKVGDYSHLKSKLPTIQAIDALPPITTVAQIDALNIKGVGPGAKTFAKEALGDISNTVYPTDLIFRKGLAKIYGLATVPTVAAATNIVKTWTGPLYVGTMFAFQAANYA